MRFRCFLKEDETGDMKQMIRRILAVLTALILLGAVSGSFAEGQRAPDYVMEGYDDSSVGRNWDDNLFFSRMQEKTGISFQFRQVMTEDNWTARKKELLEGEDLPDVLFKAGLSASDVRDLYQAGRIIDLKPYLRVQSDFSLQMRILLLRI